MSRRRLLQAGAVGAGVAGATWVTPSVLNMDQAFAAGSCPCVTPTTFNWTTYNDGDGGLNTVVGNVRITITTTNPGGQAVAPNFVVQVNEFGQAQRYWQMRQNAVDAGGITSAPQMTATFAFTNATTNAPVALCGLRFTLLDIDLQASDGNGWRDEVWVTDAAGGAATFTQTKPGGAGSPSGSGSNGDRWVGTQGNIANNSDDGNVTVAMSGSVTGFRINYRNRRESATGNLYNGSIMRVGITNIQWCP